MPSAVSKRNQERIDLKTLPGGFVVIRKFDYGETLKRRDLGLSITAGERSSDATSMQLRSLETQTYEFATAIIEHNLEDDNGKALDFRNQKHVIILDPEVAMEIEKAINDFNESPESPSKSQSENGDARTLVESSKESGTIQRPS